MLRRLDTLSDADVRAAHVEAVDWLAATAAVVPVDGWETPAGDRSTVAEQVALAAHGCELLVRSLDAADGRVTFVGRTGRTRALFARPVPTLPRQLAERAEDVLRDLRPDIAASVAALADRTQRRVAGAPDDAPCTTPLGVARLIDELPVRTGELVVRLLDVHKALGLTEPSPPSGAVEVTLAFVAALADPVKAILVLSGRIGYDVCT